MPFLVSRRLARLVLHVAPMALAAQAPTLRIQSKPTFAVQHVIEAADLQATPPSTTQGQAVTFRFKLRNTGATAATAVPYALEVNGVAISSGNAPGLKPGESWEASKGWTATPGAHTVRFVVDPSGTGGASGAPASRRSRQLGLSVAALPATEVRLIDWDAAKQAGMTYANGLQQPTTCVSWVEPIANASYEANYAVDNHRRIGWIHVGISCVVGGGRMSATVFDNLQLRNGWRVKSVLVERTFQVGGDWQYTNTPPAPGADRPRINLGLWAQALSKVHLGLKVEIEGPRGTNPYR
jgi:hypothetical protein